MTENGVFSADFSAEEKMILSGLEKARRIGRFQTITILLLLAGIVAGPATGMSFLPGQDFIVVGLSLLWAAFLSFLSWSWVFRYTLPDDKLSLQCKRIVLPNLLAKTDPAWKVVFTHNLRVNDVVESGLYKDEMNSMLRDDCFFGPEGKCVAEIYQVYFRVRTFRRGGGRYSNTIQKTETNYFSGLFFRIRFPQNFSGRTWIFPWKRKSEEEADDWAEVTEKFYEHSDKKPARTGNDSFDSQFVVFCDSSSDAKTVLTADRILNLQKIAQQFPFNAAFSFIGNYAFCMIGFDYDLFDIEPDTPIDEKYFTDCYLDIQKIKSVSKLLSA